jgi:1-acyl-sn-glycerol-3-phosphate acyltransferase
VTGSRRAASSAVTAMRPWQRIVYRTIRAVLEGFCRVFWRIDIEGRDRLPVAGPFIIAPVHRSNIDFAVVGAAVPRVVRFMAKDTIWNIAPAGRFLELMGTFPVNRELADRAALRHCEASLAHGDPVVMFPEGRRRSGDDVEGILEGPAWVACRNRVPVVPVGLGGTDRAMPIRSKLIRPTRVRVLIGEPIHPDVPLTGRVPRRSILAFRDEIRDAVQHCYDAARAS